MNVSDVPAKYTNALIWLVSMIYCSSVYVRIYHIFHAMSFLLALGQGSTLQMPSFYNYYRSHRANKWYWTAHVMLATLRDIQTLVAVYVHYSEWVTLLWIIMPRQFYRNTLKSLEDVDNNVCFETNEERDQVGRYVAVLYYGFLIIASLFSLCTVILWEGWQTVIIIWVLGTIVGIPILHVVGLDDVFDELILLSRKLELSYFWIGSFVILTNRFPFDARYLVITMIQVISAGALRNMVRGLFHITAELLHNLSTGHAVVPTILLTLSRMSSTQLYSMEVRRGLIHVDPHREREPIPNTLQYPPLSKTTVDYETVLPQWSIGKPCDSFFTESDADERICSICLDTMDNDQMVQQCGNEIKHHVFHYHCLSPWLWTQQHACPTCHWVPSLASDPQT